MLKGEVKYYPRQFYKKEGVNYYNRANIGMVFEQYNKHKQLIYCKYTFLPIDTMSVYMQEYAYNHIAHIVDYRDNNGVRWSKQYTENGFDIVYKDCIDKRAYTFDYKNNMLIHISSHGVKHILDTRYCNTVSIIDGVDYTDPFITNNENLLRYFIGELNNEDIIFKILSFKDIDIQNKVLEYINYKEDDNNET